MGNSFRAFNAFLRSLNISLTRRAGLALLAIFFLSASALAMYFVVSPPRNALSNNIVISQVYGGGGNGGSTYKNDFIELFNRGAVAVSLAGWSVQYTSAGGTAAWQVTSLNSLTLQPGQYYLVQEAQGAGGTTNLPTPDASGAIPMSATAGNVALVNSTTALATGCPSAASVIDLVGYGSSAACRETSPTTTLTNTTAALRNNNGCSETDNNSSDFTAGAPNPRNSSSLLNTCGVAGAPTITNSSPLPNATVGSSYSVTFTAAGGTGTGYTFAQTAGMLPPGLTLNGAVLSGVPTTNTGSPFTFTIQVTDSGAATGSKVFQLTVGTAAACPAPSPVPQGCGVERWSVKTGTDADAGLVNLNSATPTTITALHAPPMPASIPANNRVPPSETTQWIIHGTLVEYKLESDSDYHVVVQDGAGNTLIAEIPYPGTTPACVATSSPFLPGIASARCKFNGSLPLATTSFQFANVPVRVIGPGFFDFDHGQTGASPNQMEIHPVVEIAFPVTVNAATSPGSNVFVQLGEASATFTAVSAAGTTIAVPIDPSTAGTPPSGNMLVGPAYNLSTSATVTAPINFCVSLPYVTDADAFNRLNLLSLEGGALVDRTTGRNGTQKMVCGSLPSVSSKVVVSLGPPSAPVAPTITTQPLDQTVNVGALATFTADAMGTPTPTVQWEVSTNNGASFSPVMGATSATLNLPNVTVGQSGAKYHAVFTNSEGQATTLAATLTVNTPPTLTSNTIMVSASSNAASFTIATAFDPDQTANSLSITINGNPTTATVNGVTVSGINIAPSGAVTANVVTTCAATSATFNLVVTDAQNATGAGTLTVTVAPNTPPVLSYDPQTVPVGTMPSFIPASGPSDNGMITSLVLQSISPNNGGLTVTVNSATGQVQVTNATLADTYTVTIVATDNCNAATVATLPINVTCPTITLSPTSLPNGLAYAAYGAQMLTVTGGISPYSFTITMGALVPGLSLSSDGIIGGTPTASGTFNFTVRATDASNCPGEQTYTLTVAANPGLMFYPLPAPVRLLDTRASATVGCVKNTSPLINNETRTLTARTACSTIPAAATAIVGNITVVPSGPGFLTLFPSDAAQPTVANSNFKAGEVTNNFFTVGLGATGADEGAFKIFTSLFNGGTNSEVIIDVTGYYAPPTASGLYYHALPAPVRLLQTFPGQTGCILNGSQQLQGLNDANANPTLDLAVQGRGNTLPSPCNGIPNDAEVLVGNATTVFPSAPFGFGYLTIYPSDATRPTVASSNYGNNDIINGPFAVKLGADGKFKVYTFSTTHLVIDISGYYSASATDANGAGLLFNPLPKPMRLLETRDIPGFTLTGCYQPKAPIQGGTGGIRTQPAWGTCADQPPLTIPNTARAFVGNVSVINPVADGFGTFFPGDVGIAPTVATTNYPFPVVFGYNRHYYVGLSPVDGTFKILTQFMSDYIVDVSGYFAP